jgi:hypothetical protein
MAEAIFPRGYSRRPLGLPGCGFAAVVCGVILNRRAFGFRMAFIPAVTP